MLHYSWVIYTYLHYLHFILVFKTLCTFFCEIAVYVNSTHGRGPRSEIKSTCPLELCVVYTQVYYINYVNQCEKDDEL